MIEELANDYSNYFKVDSIDELQIIRNNTEDMLTRLEEFESLLHMVKQKSCTNIQNVIPDILQMNSHMSALSKRVDNLEKLVSHIENNLNDLEKRVNIAKNHFEVPGSFKSLLKPIFGVSNSSTNVQMDSQPIHIIDIDKYFTSDAEEAVEVEKLNDC